MEVMETEALEILTKALKSEPPSCQLPQKDVAGLGPVGVGLQDGVCHVVSTHTHSKGPTKVKS